MLIFHIADPDDWRSARRDGCYTTSTQGRTLDEEGFVHCSRYDQLDGVLDVEYDDGPGPLTLLVIDTDRLDAPRRLDDVPEAGDEHPHIYGPLNTSAVIDVAHLARGADGRWQLPPGRIVA